MKSGGRNFYSEVYELKTGIGSVGLALLDTLSTTTGGQKNGEKLNPRGKFWYKNRIFLYQHRLVSGADAGVLAAQPH